MDKKEYESHWIENTHCIASEVNQRGVRKVKECSSSDAMGLYENVVDDDTSFFTGYCRSCSQAFFKEDIHNSSHAPYLGVDGGEVVERKVFERKPKQPRITKDQIAEIISYGYDAELTRGPNKGKQVRGIKEKYNKFFGHVTKKDPNGNPIVRYYPETDDNGMSGYKSRTFPKSFGWENVGITGSKNHLSGQIKFKDMHFRDIVLVGGEEDKVAFFQQWDEYQQKISKKKGSTEEYAPMPVVSPNTGEGGSLKQIRDQYDFINRAERIFIGFDNDDAGRKAAAEVAEIFPKEKVFIIYWSYKDANNAINNKDGIDYSAQTIRDFYNAKPYHSSGIVTSIEADSLMEEELMRPKMTLPDFMSDLQKKMAGGIPLGYCVNWIAETGIGKSTLINEAIRHWVYTSPYKIGILSLELTAAQYMIAMLSREVGYKINLIENPEEAVEFINKPEVIEARKHLRETEHGEERFTLLDERDGDLEQVKKQCELLVNKYGCKVLIIDPIQDLFEGVSMDEQTAFIKWIKVMLKKGVSFNNVCHVRKGGNSTDKEGKRILRELNEDSVHGISAIVKSAGANIFATRDKYEECPIRKNITYPTLGKCRWTGITGRINDWYYELETHTMYDLREYVEKNPSKIPSGFDIDYNPFEKKSGSTGKTKKEDNTFKMHIEEEEEKEITLPTLL